MNPDFEIEPDDNELGLDLGSATPPPVRPASVTAFGEQVASDDPFSSGQATGEGPHAPITSFAVGMPAGPPTRDRIVVLGRRRAGKTIYLSRLYESAWNGRFQGLHMRAIPGPGNGHERFMETIAQLREGSWPESTMGSTTTPIDVEFGGETHLLIALDYPGEVFRRAFVQGSEEDAAIELRDHVDRAAGVILLLDPDVAVTGRIEETVDDDYGMSEAIRRIRTQPNGENVPIALVLTKCDIHEGLVKEEGGLRAFFHKHYHNILRVSKKPSRMFAAAAVRVRRDARGTFLPTLKHDAINILEPMVYCIKQIQGSRRIEMQTESMATQRRFRAERQSIEIAEAKRRSFRWALGGVLGILGFGLLVFANYWFFVHEKGG